MSAAAPPSGAKGFDPGHPKTARRQLPRGPPESRQGLAGLPSLRDPYPTPRAPRPSSFHWAAPDPCPRRLSPSPHLFSSAPRKSLAPAHRLGAPHSPGEELSPSARARAQRAAAGGGASAELLTAGPAAPAADRAGKGAEAAGCHLPALPPHRVTPQSAAP